MAKAVNVVILLLDTLRHDYAMEIPAYRSLAKRGWVFERMYGGSTFTYPNLCTLRSGLYPHRHGWRTWPHGGPFQAEATLCGCLKKAGYHIDTTLNVPPENATRELNRPRREPFFRFCWFTGIHDQMFRAGMPERGIPHATYVSYLQGAKEWASKAVALFKDDLIVLLGDHGVGLQGDRLKKEGLDVGAGQVYDFRIRVPCVLAGPGIEPRTIKEVHSLADLMPTILDLLGLSIPEGLDGVPVGQRQEPVFLEAQSPHSIWPSKEPNVFGAVAGSLKVMATPEGWRCYDLASDPGESTHRADLLIQEEAQRLVSVILEKGVGDGSGILGRIEQVHRRGATVGGKPKAAYAEPAAGALHTGQCCEGGLR